MQMKQSRFTLILFGIIAVGAVVLIGSLVLLQQANKQTQQLRAQIDAKEAEFESREQKLRHLQEDKQTLEELNLRLSQLDRSLITYEFVPSYLRQIQDTTTRTNNMIKSIMPSERKPLNLSNSFFAEATQSELGASGPVTVTEEGTGDSVAQANGETSAANAAPAYQVMSINLDLQGNYMSLMNLLDEFRKFRKIIYVKSIDLTPRRKAEGGNGISARLMTHVIITPDQNKTQPQPAVPAPGQNAGQSTIPGATPDARQASTVGGSR